MIDKLFKENILIQELLNVYIRVLNMLVDPLRDNNVVTDIGNLEFLRHALVKQVVYVERYNFYLDFFPSSVCISDRIHQCIMNKND